MRCPATAVLPGVAVEATVLARRVMAALRAAGMAAARRERAAARSGWRLAMPCHWPQRAEAAQGILG